MPVSLEEVETALLAGRLKDTIAKLAALSPERLNVPPSWIDEGPARAQPVTIRFDDFYSWLEEHVSYYRGLCCYCLALIFEHGFHIERNMRTAIALYERSIGAGVPEATYKLGSIYLHGRNQYGDVLDGVELLRNAASMGLARAAHLLGGAYFRGELIDRNFSRGYLYLLLGAELGNEDSRRAVVIIETMHPKETFGWEKGQVAAILQNVENRRRLFHEAGCDATRIAARKREKTIASRGQPGWTGMHHRAVA